MENAVVIVAVFLCNFSREPYICPFPFELQNKSVDTLTSWSTGIEWRVTLRGLMS